MPFPYRYICDLLQKLDDEVRSTRKQQVPSKDLIEDWFRDHRIRLDAPTVDPSAIISTLLPERRTDRVYNIQAAKLQSIIGHALVLGHSRVKELRRYQTPGLGVDLGDCVESILNSTPNPIRKGDEVTVEEIDEALGQIAAVCRFSSPVVRAACSSSSEKRETNILGAIYGRLSARDAKWLARLILKNYQPVILEECVVLRSYHVLLPRIMKVRDDLRVATAFLRHVDQSPDHPSAIASVLKPALGTKVGRQRWEKGRSIKHCVDMIRGRQVSCEQKMDGEYCQIHIDLGKHPKPIQIFSKSGKDSTKDRIGLHHTIRESLQLGKKNCPFNIGCILEGELLVYSSKDQKILPFHKIRKHVSRSGSFIGIKNDSQPHDYEHLMIVYYDVLMIDNETLLGVCQSQRFERLKRLVTCQKGYAELVQRQVIRFSHQNAASLLRCALVRCIISRGEGLVIKPDEPYFDFNVRRKPYSSCNIKLKKEYIQGFGDVGDFAVIGASYDAAKSRTYKIPNLKWTHFFIGCLENKNGARARSEKPRFMVTNIVELNATLLSTVRTHCNPASVPIDKNDAMELDFRGISTAKKPTDVFMKPLVFDMRCFSFDKEANSRFWSMRFPMVSKIHFDRSWRDTISFAELQKAALEATEAAELEDSQEMRHWISELEKAEPRGIPVDTISQETVSTDMTPSPRSRREKSQARTTVLEIIHEDSTGAPLPALAVTDAPLPALPTPPRSSAVDFFGANTKTISAEVPGPIVQRQKRPIEWSKTPNSKKQRRLSSMQLTGSMSTRSSSSYVHERQVLEAINGNSSPVKQRSRARILDSLSLYLPVQEATSSPAAEEVIPSSVTGSFHTAAELVSSPPHPKTVEQHGSERKQIATPRRTQHEQAASCVYLGSDCGFAKSSISLAPCISNYAWVTDSLLSRHGIAEFVTEPETWVQTLRTNVFPAGGREGFGSSQGGQSPRGSQKSRVRKICLVETKRPAATHAFLQRIEQAGLKLRNGQREWVAVYDWRILEDVASMEAGMRPKGSEDPWRKWHFGIA